MRSYQFKFAGKNAYPQFVKYKPNKYPWYVLDKKEEKRLEEAAECAIWLARELETKDMSDFNIFSIGPDTEAVTMFVKAKQGYDCAVAKIPKEIEEVYPKPAHLNELAIAKILKFKKGMELECQLIRYPEPLQNYPDQQPLYPAMLMTVEAKSGYILPPSAVENYEEHPEEALQGFLDGLIESKVCPKKIKVRDQRTFALMEDLAKKLGAKIMIQNILPALDEAQEAFLEHMDMADIDELANIIQMVEMMEDMPDEMLATMPKELIDSLVMLLDEGTLPDELAEQIKAVLDRLG